MFEFEQKTALKIKITELQNDDYTKKLDGYRGRISIRFPSSYRPARVVIFEFDSTNQLKTDEN